MNDERFEEWLRAQSQSYHRPSTPDAESMWSEIELQVFDTPTIRTPWWGNTWLRMAAMLAVGVGVGRASMNLGNAVSTPVTNDTPVVQEAAIPVVSDPSTLRYIGQTVALLASFESDAPVPRSDSAIKERANELLHSTRLLMDSPNNTDPIVHSLLEDLELVLVQIVQMPPKRNASDVDLIKEAMEQRDVMPRLIAAATTTSAE